MRSSWLLRESVARVAAPETAPWPDSAGADAEDAFVPPEAEAATRRPPAVLSPSAPDGEIVRRADALGIPWRRVLCEEIEAEQRLRKYLAELGGECPLLEAADVLSFSLLRSWRVRDRIESLACEARTSAVRGALRQLRLVFRRLTGAGDRRRMLLSEHLGFAYQRVLLLQRVRRAAARSRGTLPERLAFICTSARCSYDDAAWAACEEDSPSRGHRLERAVRKVREEGFLIPRAESEARALSELRRMVRMAGRSRRRKTTRPLSSPRRVPLPLDAF
jgi:hypothetical protein